MRSTENVRRWDYLLGLALALVLLISCRTTVMADTSVPIYAGSEVLESNTDTRGFSVTYRYTAASKGYFQYKFASAGADDWLIEVKRDDGSEIKSSRCNQTNSFNSIKFPTDVGQMYYITVTKYYDRSGSSQYKLLINHKKSNVWETENNNSESDADTIKANVDYYGTLYEHDRDWYKFKMPGNGYVTFSLSEEEMSTSYRPFYNLVIMDKQGNVLCDWHGYDINSQRFPYRNGTIFYAYVSNYNNASFIPYKLRVNYTKSDYYEKEPNDRSKLATSIQTGKTYTGVINSKNDYVDYYKFVLKTSMKFKLNFGPEDLSRTGSWSVDLKDSQNNTVELLRGDTKQSKSGYLKKGTYYIVVQNYNNTANKPYTLKLSTSAFSVTTPVLAKCKITTTGNWFISTKATVKLKKKSTAADGYQLLLSGSKKMAKATAFAEINGNKASQTIDNIGNKYNTGTYKYVAARAFVKDPFGDYITSGMSNALKVKFPKN